MMEKNVVGPILRESQIKYKNLADKKTLQLSKEIGISYHILKKLMV